MNRVLTFLLSMSLATSALAGGWTDQHFRIVEYFTTWCGPCRTWKARDLPILKRRFQVEQIDAQGGKDGITSVPVVIAKRWDGNRWQQAKRWDGYTPAATIAAEIDQQIVALNGDTSEQGTPAGMVSTSDPNTETVTEYRTETVQVPYIVMEQVRVPGSGWNEGRTACGNRGCSMCYPQYRTQAVTKYRTETKRVPYQKTVTKPAVETELPECCKDGEDIFSEAKQGNPFGISNPVTRTRALGLCRLTTASVFGDLGGGNAEVSIEAAETYGCRAISVERDAQKHAEAVANVKAAEAAGRIRAGQVELIHGDILDFDPTRCTAALAYLEVETLETVRPIIERINRVVTPFHQVPGLEQTKVLDCYVYERPQNFAAF